MSGKPTPTTIDNLLKDFDPEKHRHDPITDVPPVGVETWSEDGKHDQPTTPTRTKHPGRTPAQRRVLDEIGCGNYSPAMSTATRKVLLDAGLIEPCGEKPLGRDGFGMITVPEFQMPIPVHMQWCSAVAEDVTDDD